MASKDTHYKVYLAAYKGDCHGYGRMQGPDGGAREADPEHHAIYVETVPGGDEDPNNRGSGCLFHSVGGTIWGMDFERKDTIDPRLTSRGKRMTPMGWVSHGKFRDEFEAVCRRVPLPHSQRTLANRKIYPNIPLRHCQHWALDAIHALCVAEVLEPLTPSDSRAPLNRVN
ncbi:hypothetical protein F5144DRAFT_607095 [Chaetomium tenue]|uniref:Uncharacterized protein n=1 Tax=Chaetomium tenue TaxID=1854479 RepID=A0ACB7NXZ0_9PEZI|nr:hypothetical protein F5144DRAFT_607095 [Chaetomium globosum]